MIFSFLRLERERFLAILFEFSNTLKRGYRQVRSVSGRSAGAAHVSNSAGASNLSTDRFRSLRSRMTIPNNSNTHTSFVFEFMSSSLDAAFDAPFLRVLASATRTRAWMGGDAKPRRGALTSHRKAPPRGGPGRRHGSSGRGPLYTETYALRKQLTADIAELKTLLTKGRYELNSVRSSSGTYPQYPE